MRFLLMSGVGDGLGLALRLRYEGHDVTAHIQHPESKHDYDGLLKKVDKFDKVLTDDTIVIFDSNGGGKLADRLRQRGHYVFMGSVFMDQLEQDRGTALGLMEEAGIQVPHSETFTDWESGRKYTEAHETRPPQTRFHIPGRLVFKASGELGEHCMSYVSSDAGDMVEMLKYFESTYGQYPCEFELQDFVKGVALSTEGWMGPSGFIAPFNHTLEKKQLMNDDLGPSGGCSGNVVWLAEGDNWIVNEGIRKMERILLEYGYIGPIDLNTIVNDDGLWGLEFTPRFGWDALPAFLEMIDGPLAPIISDLAMRRTPQINLKPGVGSALRVSIPPYPSKAFEASPGIPIRGLTKEDRPHCYFYSVSLNKDNQLVTSDSFMESDGFTGVIAAFTGFSNSIESAMAGPMEIAERVKVPNKQFRTDLTSAFQKEFEEVQRLLALKSPKPSELALQSV